MVTVFTAIWTNAQNTHGKEISAHGAEFNVGKCRHWSQISLQISLQNACYLFDLSGVFVSLPVSLPMRRHDDSSIVCQCFLYAFGCAQSALKPA
jgi:hypothetical protein